MKRVAAFGNAGGGKFTLAKALANITGLPLHPIDSIKYKSGGEEIPYAEYLEIHAGLLKNERWIIDGFGCVASTWERFAAADTLVYVDLPLVLHYLVGDQAVPQRHLGESRGVAANSPMWRGTLAGLLEATKAVRRTHQVLNPGIVMGRDELAAQASALADLVAETKALVLASPN